MSRPQPGILAPPPPHARFLAFQLVPGADARGALQALNAAPLANSAVVGFGMPLVAAVSAEVPGLRAFPALTGPGLAVPSTQAAVWLRLGGTDRGDLVHLTRAVVGATGPWLVLTDLIDAFVHHDSRDLSGYEDGTENPVGDAAAEAAFVAGAGPGLDGGAFVAVQQWLHDLDVFEAMSTEEQDHMVGRRRADNVELDDAPPSAHVKRTAQENYEPPAFVVRRSMPWSDADSEGLVFVSFAGTLDHFERQLRRMLGHDDGVTDALFGMSRPLTGGYYWCPPLDDAGLLDLSALGE